MKLLRHFAVTLALVAAAQAAATAQTAVGVRPPAAPGPTVVAVQARPLAVAPARRVVVVRPAPPARKVRRRVARRQVRRAVRRG